MKSSKSLSRIITKSGRKRLFRFPPLKRHTEYIEIAVEYGMDLVMKAGVLLDAVF